MKNLNRILLSKLLITSICCLATIIPAQMPAVAIAMDCCEEDECEPTYCWRKFFPFIGGAVAGGAIAVLACREGHRKHGDSSGASKSSLGPTGPTGPAGAAGTNGTGFTPDNGHSLTFNFRDVQFTPTPIPTTANGASILPFVVEPNGTMIESGTATRVTINTSPFTVPNLGTLIVTNPFFGEYHAGVQVTFDTPATFTSMIITLRADVTASRDSSTTTTLETDTNVTAFPATASEVQVQTDYAYGPADVP